MKSVEKKKDYHSFMLRLWVDVANGERDWRISIENPSTRERRGFASLEDLCSFLKKMITENQNNAEKNFEPQTHEGE